MPPSASAASGSSGTETVVQTASVGQEVPVSTHVYNHVRRARAVALVEVYADRPYEGPDTLVLRSVEGEGRSPEEFLYWNEIAVAGAEHSGHRVECAFALGEAGRAHEGTATERADLDSRRYTLAWRPTGRAEEEIVLIQSAPYETVWSVGDRRHVAAGLVAVRFRECPDVSFAEPPPRPVPELPDSLAGEQRPYDTEGRLFPVPDPERARPVAARRSGAAADGESSTEEVPLPDGERWVYLFQYVDRAGNAGEDPSWESPAQAPHEETRLLGAYRATEAGTYRRARASDGEVLTAEGPEQSDVLLPAFTADAHRQAAYARLSMVGVPGARAERTAEQLAAFDPAVVGSLTPVPLRQGAPGGSLEMRDLCPLPGLEAEMPIDPEAYLDETADTPGCPLYLASPLGAPAARLRDAERARARRRAWEEKLGGTGDLSALVGSPCFDPAHDREHLRPFLADDTVRVSAITGTANAHARSETPTEKYDLQSQWAPFSPEEGDRSPAADSTALLGQFLFGLRRQRAYLRWNRDRAVRAAEAALDVPLFRQLVRDGCAVAATDAEAPALEALRTALFPLLARLPAVGGGRQLVDQIQRDPTDRGPFDRVQTLDEKDYATLTAPLDEAAEGPVEALADDPLFKSLFALAAGSTAALHQLAIGSTSAFLAPDRGRTTGGRAPRGAALLGAHLMRASHDSFTVERTVDADGRTTALRYGTGGTAEVELTWTGAGEGPAADRPPAAGTPAGGHWRLRLRGQVREDAVDAYRPVAQAAGRAGEVLEVLDLLLTFYTAGQTAERGEAGVGEALAVGSGLVGLAERVLGDDASSSRLGRLLATAGTWISGVDTAWSAYREMTQTEPRGLGEVAESDWGGLLGEAMMSGGSALMSGAYGTATITLPSGGVLILAGGLTLWLNHLEETADRAAADPLADWLPTDSLWGAGHDARGTAESRDRLFALVRPGTDRDAAPARDQKLGTGRLPAALRRQAEAFTERAFTFPTTATVRHRRAQARAAEARPRGLLLRPALGYLPAYGTLMVDVEVIPEEEGRIGVPLQCAVHYVDDGDQTRYCVKPGRNGRIERLSIRNEMSLPEQAVFDDWALAKSGTIVANGESITAPALPVYVGAAWHPIDPDEGSGPGPAAVDQIEASADEGYRRQKARLQHEGGRFAAEKAAIISGPDGLEQTLESGRFALNGNVYFSPLKPFVPTPSVPESLEKARQRNMAFDRIRYSYPEGAEAK